MEMNQLKLIIKNEYVTDVTSRSFWVATLILPVVMIAFGAFVGFLASQSDSLQAVSNSMTAIDKDADLSGSQVLGMLLGMFLTIFIMIYGANIFNKVKAEKSNRIVEIMATCVDGRTMMLGKIISVGIIGLTQLLIWSFFLVITVISIALVFDSESFNSLLTDSRLWSGLLWSVLYFIGGYVFFGSLYAACGAMSDKNNENQEYMTVLTFILLGSFYIGEFAVDNGGSAFVKWMAFIPFTSPTVGAVQAISGSSPVWVSLLSLLFLFVCAWIALAVSGKIYTSSMLLKGKKFTPRDIITFLRAK